MGGRTCNTECHCANTPRIKNILSTQSSLLLAHTHHSQHSTLRDALGVFVVQPPPKSSQAKSMPSKSAGSIFWLLSSCHVRTASSIASSFSSRNTGTPPMTKPLLTRGVLHLSNACSTLSSTAAGHRT